MFFDPGYAGGIQPALALPERPVPNGNRAGWPLDRSADYCPALTAEDIRACVPFSREELSSAFVTIEPDGHRIRRLQERRHGEPNNR